MTKVLSSIRQMSASRFINAYMDRADPETSIVQRLRYAAKPQVRTLVNHFSRERGGSLTQDEAALNYNIRSLSRRVTDLRKIGVPIKRTMIPTVTGRMVASYYLTKEDAAELRRYYFSNA